MTISDIIREVSLAVGEEYLSLGTEPHQVAYGNAQIRSCAKHALLWLARNAPLWALDGSDEAGDPGFLVSSGVTKSGNKLTLPGGYVRLSRVRIDGWHRAISEPLDEASDEYLMLSDGTAEASLDRPQAAIINGNPKTLEVFPDGNSYEIVMVCVPSNSITQLSSASVSTAVPIPPKLRGAFIYYTAYLVLASDGDSRASAMLETAKGMLG